MPLGSQTYGPITWDVLNIDIPIGTVDLEFSVTVSQKVIFESLPNILQCTLVQIYLLH